MSSKVAIGSSSVTVDGKEYYNIAVSSIELEDIVNNINNNTIDIQALKEKLDETTEIEIDEADETIRCYYNLNNILEILDSSYTPDSTWAVTINDKLNDYWSSSRSLFIKDDFIEALGSYLYGPKKYLFITENTVILKINEDLVAKLNEIITKINILLPDYVEMYNILNTQITTLKTKAITKFNDTPTEEGDYSTDKYTSTITQQESEVDYSIFDKINLIKQKQRHLIQQFCEEFKGFIIWTN